ncbi:uncharacterized protein TRIREDRAFT_112472 [Trichoderma reesei QM6a]|uniref:Predicted protein n=1 Tax=Hypocrea jecorina (strain QM6a) TaxID=431241 RepID=G0RX51_HYPJQ|nr:uncharacterized protein TRIREDRAFT_112472 [Trichoderma reesei QM6a]EGR44233.1 predicted protein [Trichoderma reesei QM6a]
MAVSGESPEWRIWQGRNRNGRDTARTNFHTTIQFELLVQQGRDRHKSALKKVAEKLYEYLLYN